MWKAFKRKISKINSKIHENECTKCIIINNKYGNL